MTTQLANGNQVSVNKMIDKVKKILKEITPGLGNWVKIISNLLSELNH